MQTAVVRAKNLIWALLIRSLPNDPRLDRHRDDSGKSFKKETAFRNYPSDLAGRRVRPILRDIMSKDEYMRPIESGTSSSCGPRRSTTFARTSPMVSLTGSRSRFNSNTRLRDPVRQYSPAQIAESHNIFWSPSQKWCVLKDSPYDFPPRTLSSRFFLARI